MQHHAFTACRLVLPCSRRVDTFPVSRLEISSLPVTKTAKDVRAVWSPAIPSSGSSPAPDSDRPRPSQEQSAAAAARVTRSNHRHAGSGLAVLQQGTSGTALRCRRAVPAGRRVARGFREGCAGPENGVAGGRRRAGRDGGGARRSGSRKSGGTGCSPSIRSSDARPCGDAANRAGTAACRRRCWLAGVARRGARLLVRARCVCVCVCARSSAPPAGRCLCLARHGGRRRWGRC